VLEVALSGSATVEEDIGRGIEIEVTVRGQIVGHAFTEKFDSNGDHVATVKTLKLKVSEADEISIVPRRARGQAPGQTTIDGEVVGTDGRVHPAEEEASTTEAIIDAEVVGELPPGEAAAQEDDVAPVSHEGDTDATGSDSASSDEAPESEQPTTADRPVMVLEEAWSQLNRDQKADVAEQVEQVIRYANGLQGTENPTDRAWYDERLRVIEAHLLDEYGISLIPEEELPEPEVPAEGTPAPVTIDNVSDLGDEVLQLRRAYLSTQAGLPPDAKAARDAEVKLIDDELSVRSIA
jgi:hypothetical protein